MEAGLDSLGAVELRNRIAAEFEAKLPATLTFDYPSVAALAQYLAQYRTGLSSSAPGPEEIGGMQLVEWSQNAAERQLGTEVAAIACRYPGPATNGGDTGAAFWRGFYSSADLQSLVPLGRWDMERVYAPEGGADAMAFYARFAAFCAGIEHFDAAAFRLSAPEALAVDPQVRMLMEETAAACTASQVLGSRAGNGQQLVGVFVGSMYHEHLDLIAASGPKLSPQAIVGNGAPYMVGRLSYTFGLTGPCVSTDTACSSSLVAAHLAASALHAAECGAAVAGGANVMLLAYTTSAICQLQALSPVGRCKTFEASADGYGRGEGVAVLVLRCAGSSTGYAPACAVIRGSEVNQGGRSSGLTAPNGPAQSALVRAALAAANVDAASLSVVSVHGTGTPLGDPIEVGALSSAHPGSSKGGAHVPNIPLTLISNKACYGHTEGTAGITGLLAALGPLQHAAVPAVMHLRNPNSYVTAALSDWQRSRAVSTCVPRQAAPVLCGGGSALFTGTSSFGMSGVNAHALLAAPAISPPTRKVNLAWQRQRHFSLAKPHALLATAGAAGGVEATFVCRLGGQGLAYLWEHQLSGTPCLPAAALLELSAAAATAVVPDGDQRGSALLCSAAVAGLVTLPDGMQPSTPLTCSVQLRSGAVAVLNGGQLVLTSSAQRVATEILGAGQAAAVAHRSNAAKALIGALQMQPTNCTVGFLEVPVCLAAESYNLHPGALQAGLLPEAASSAVLAAAECAMLPTSATAVAAAVISRGGSHVQLAGQSFAASALPVGLHNAQFQPAQQLGLKLQSNAVETAELLYAVAWQAAAPMDPAAEQEAAAGRRVALQRRVRGTASAQQQAAQAGADMVRLLAHHREALPDSTLSMLSHGAMPAVAAPTGQRDHTAAAFVGGILKNLPYELPTVTARLADSDPARSNGSERGAGRGDYAFSARPLPSAWQADMYGAASRAGSLYRPLLTYGAAPDRDDQLALTGPGGPAALPADAACMISGGLGGLGMLAADWAAGCGAQALVLLGRSGCLSVGASAGALLTGHALVVMTKSDAALTEDAAAAAQLTRRLPRRFRASIHAAGVQVEARLLKQTLSTMRQAAAPKLAAVESCPGAAVADPLAVNLLFSSVSSVTGNAGHANYAAANAALDAIAERQASMGAPVAAVQWGAWASVGMVHNRYRITQKQAAAMGMLSSEAGLSAMAAVLRGSVASAAALMGSVLGAAPQSYWRNLLQNAPAVPPIYSSLEMPRQTATAPAAAAAPQASSAAPAPASRVSIEATVRQIAASILGVEVDDEQPLALQGLDSLAGLEMRQKLQEALGVDLALLAEDPQGATVGSIVAEAVSKAPQPGGTAAAATTAGSSTAAEQVKPSGPLWISPTPVAIKMRLFCLPWAGGVSENLFARWSMMLPASVQVCPIEIPGRGRREGEPALTTVHELAMMLAHSLPLQDKPYAFFGTCLGAIVGYEVIREVARTKCAPMPVAFMPAAVSPPHVYASVVMKIYMQRRLRWGEEPPLDEVLTILKGWKDMPREKLLLAFEAGHFAGVEDMKRSERLFNRVAPMGVNDIMMAVQYRYDATLPPLKIPVIVFDGTKDNTIPSGYMKGWRHHTTASYKHVKVAGDHYFVSTHYREVTATVNQECLALMERMKGGIMGAGHSWVADVNDLPPAGAAGEGASEAAATGEQEGATVGRLARGRQVLAALGLSGATLYFAVMMALALALLAFTRVHDHLL